MNVIIYPHTSRVQRGGPGDNEKWPYQVSLWDDSGKVDIVLTTEGYDELVRCLLHPEGDYVAPTGGDAGRAGAQTGTAAAPRD